MSSTLLIVLGVLSLVGTAVTLVRVRHPAFLGFWIMMTGWVLGEYPVFHIAAQAAAAVVLVAFGGLGAAAGWVGLALLVMSWLGLLLVKRVGANAAITGDAALTEALGPTYLDRLDPGRRRALRSRHEPGLTRHPLRFDATSIVVDADIAYGDHPKRNLLDIYRPRHADGPLPVVLQIHGGAWVIGHKRQQGQPLLHRLAANGYVCVAMNYRLGPKSRFPDQIIDVKRAIAWIRTHIAEYGGDPDIIVLTGGSAGGHLSSLAALTPNLAAWQPGFEQADTSVAACIPFYGPPDFRDRDAIRGRLASLEPFLRRMVMPGRQTDFEELWDLVSPISHVRRDAPPFFVIQGANDVLVWREEARAFVAALRAVSENPVAYWEVPGAQHAFDTFNSHRSAVAVDMVEKFLGWVIASHTEPSPAPEQATHPGATGSDA